MAEQTIVGERPDQGEEQGRQNARALSMGKHTQKQNTEEEKKGAKGSLYAERVKGKKLKQNSKLSKNIQQQQDPLNAEDDEDQAKRKLKGKRQKQKCKLTKNIAQEEEEEVEERTDDTRHGDEHDEKGRKPKENGSEQAVAVADALKMGKQKLKIMKQASSMRSMFADGFEERRDLEQYFWSERTVLQLMQALRPTAWHSEHGHVCCLAAPSLAHAFYATQGRAEALLDIDKRFEYLPGFRFFDLCNPASSDSDDFRIVVFDPPFFYIPLPILFQAVLVAVHGNLQAKLLVGFLRREEEAFLRTFAPFHLRRTRFVLEYATVKPNKWRNYALYANIDLPGIKRIS